jgi:RNA polymerase sigma factor (sigma-70 family)
VATVTRTPHRDPLTEKAEAALAGRQGYIPLDPAEEKALARRAHRGDTDAAWALVLANHNFVRRLAQRYLRDDVEMEDLVAEGLVGLLEATERFDPDRGIKFITYGVWWSKRAMLRFLRTMGHPVHVPKYKEHENAELRRTHARLMQDLGRAPDVQELVAAAGADERAVHEYLALSGRSTSVEELCEDGDGGLPDGRAGAEDACIEADALDRLRDVLPTLPDRERAVLRSRFGLEGAPVKTLATVGEEIGLTKERVRQIEHGACAQLRAAIELPRASRRRGLAASLVPRRLWALPCGVTPRPGGAAA